MTVAIAARGTGFLSGGSGVTFTDTDVTAGSSYSYRVTASDGTNSAENSPMAIDTYPSTAA